MPEPKAALTSWTIWGGVLGPVAPVVGLWLAEVTPSAVDTPTLYATCIAGVGTFIVAIGRNRVGGGLKIK